MTYRLKLLPIALKEWKKPTLPIQSQFKKKLQKRLVNPHVPASKLKGYERVYKIKLRAAGYRLAYEVIDDELTVCILAIGKREKDSVYRALNKRIRELRAIR